MYVVKIDLAWLLAILTCVFCGGVAFRWYLCGWILVGKAYLAHLTETEWHAFFLDITRSFLVLGLIILILFLLILLIRLFAEHKNQQAWNRRERKRLLKEMQILEKKSRGSKKEVSSLKEKLAANDVNLDKCRQELERLKQQKQRCYCFHSHKIPVFSPEHCEYRDQMSPCCGLVSNLKAEITVLKKKLENTKKVAKAHKLWQMAQLIDNLQNEEASDWMMAVKSIMPWLIRQAVNLETSRLKSKVVANARVVVAKDEKIEGLELRCQKLRATLTEKQAIITQRNSILDSKTDEIFGLTKKLSRTTTSQVIDPSPVELQQKDNEIVLLKDEVQLWQSKYERLQKVKLNTESDLSKVRRELRDVRSKNDELVTKLANHATTSVNLEKNKQVENEDLSKLQAQADLAESRIKDLVGKVETLETANSSLRNEIKLKDEKICFMETKTLQVDSLQDQLRQKNNYVQDVWNKVSGLIKLDKPKAISVPIGTDDDYVKTHALISQAAQYVAKLEAKVTTIESTNSQLQGDVHNLQEKVGSARLHYSTLEGNVVQFQAENATLKSHIIELEGQLLTVKESAEASHATILESERAEFHRKLNEEAAKLVDKEQQISQFNEKCQSLENALAAVQAQLNQTQKKIYSQQLQTEQDEKRALMTGAVFNAKQIAEQMLKVTDLLDKENVAADKGSIVDRVRWIVNIYKDFYAAWSNLDQHNIHRGVGTLFHRTDFMIKDLACISEAMAKASLIWRNSETKEPEPIARAVLRVIHERMDLFRDMGNLKAQMGRAYPDVETKERLMHMSGKEVFDVLRRLVDDHLRNEAQKGVDKERQVMGLKKKRTREVDDEG